MKKHHQQQQQQPTRMSILSKAILVCSVLGSTALIYHVHTSQEEERARLHEGVIRDQERQRFKEAAFRVEQEKRRGEGQKES